MRKTQEDMLKEGKLQDYAFLDGLGTGGLDPSDEEMDTAPFLDVWWIGLSAKGFGTHVCGRVKNHPYVFDGPITTTRPMAADTRRGWMKTLNTLYRLGEHM